MAVLYCARPRIPYPSDPYDIGELVKPLRDRLYTAMLHSPRRRSGGTSGLAVVSGYRDAGRQWDIRVERVGRRNACNPAAKARPATAVPAIWNGTEWVGGSDHQRRTAVDVGGVDLMWLYRNCRAFGLWHNVSTENWHYVVSGTPTVPIVEYPGKTYDNAGPIVIPQPDPIADPEEFTVDAEAKAAFDQINERIDARAEETRLWVRQELAKVTEAQNKWIKGQNGEANNVTISTGDRVIKAISAALGRG